MRGTMIVLALILMAGPVWAQDAEGERQLIATGKRVDQSAARSYQGRVTAKIVEQWKGTQFTFANGATPRELTAQDVQEYRNKGLGYGNVSILLAMAANQSGPRARSVNEILAMRQSKGMGWGGIATALGYTSLGDVQSSVKKTDQALRVEKTDKPTKTGKVDKTAKVDAVERPSKPEKIEKMEKVEKIEKVEKMEKVDRGK